MDLGLRGKVALVLAASKGLGRASAAALAKEGAAVVIGARNRELLARAAHEIEQESGSRVVAVPTDVTQAEDIRRIVATTAQEFGRLDILVNNAGGPPSGIFATLNDEQWIAAFELNLLSTVRLVRVALPYLRQALTDLRLQHIRQARRGIRGQGIATEPAREQSFGNRTSKVEHQYL